MKKGYRYRRFPCYVCGDMIADNWYIRHLESAHPVRAVLKGAAENDQSNKQERTNDKPETKCGNCGGEIAGVWLRDLLLGIQCLGECKRFFERP